MKINLISISNKQTEKIASYIGQNLKGGEVIELISDVGGGKTTFVRGLVHGADSKDHVASPTFTICNVYKAPKFSICHFDFYRLNEAGLIEHELHETVDFNKDVTIIEWSDIVAHVLPQKRLIIKIHSSGEEKRKLEITCPDSLLYLIDNIKKL